MEWRCVGGPAIVANRSVSVWPDGRLSPRAGRCKRQIFSGQFDYVIAGKLEETLRILEDREGEAKLLSGGYSLLPLMSSAWRSRPLLVDLRDVEATWTSASTTTT